MGIPIDTIQDGVVVIMHYTLKNDQGEVLDSSDGGDALPAVTPVQATSFGAEKQLTGKAVGDALDVLVAPEEGYGVHNPAMVQEVPKDAFSRSGSGSGAQFDARRTRSASFPSGCRGHR